MQRFGEKLRVLRKRRGLTVRQLAAMLGVTHSHIVGIERSKHKPSVEMVIKVADVFDVSIDRLLRDNLELDGPGLAYAKVWRETANPS